MSLPPSSFQGPFVLIAKITVPTSSADEVSKLLGEVRKSAEGDPEPDCLTYRPVREITEASSDKTLFSVFEKYTTPQALVHHREQPAYKAFRAKVGEIGAQVEVNFYDEVGFGQ